MDTLANNYPAIFSPRRSSASSITLATIERKESHTTRVPSPANKSPSARSKSYTLSDSHWAACLQQTERNVMLSATITPNHTGAGAPSSPYTGSRIDSSHRKQSWTNLVCSPSRILKSGVSIPARSSLRRFADSYGTVSLYSTSIRRCRKEVKVSPIHSHQATGSSPLPSRPRTWLLTGNPSINRCLRMPPDRGLEDPEDQGLTRPKDRW